LVDGDGEEDEDEAAGEARFISATSGCGRAFCGLVLVVTLAVGFTVAVVFVRTEISSLWLDLKKGLARSCL
jgi:hypothetical protein